MNRTDVIGHSSGRRTPLVYGGVYIWHDAAAMQAYLASTWLKASWATQTSQTSLRATSRCSAGQQLVLAGPSRRH